MSNYLPVLLVSVSTNSIPDDSSLSTLPRGQVDYLSHNWEEEDVWRSWRNMTRQKNEIANGMRLENASWRTWWKQRNKLKTVSPETLNWLKDSDVTWLYGPLHTAVDWSPPPRPPPVDTERKPSTQDRLDLSEPKHKSILKYRSISELLTSDLPSPLFSPAESESETENKLHPRRVSVFDDSAEGSSSSTSKRPALPYTKSDTHIARWGPNRAFRKDSPPRIEPPEASTSSYLSPNPVSDGYSNGDDHSSSNSTSPSPRAALSELGGQSSHGQPQKKKHITFNTFVEQCIAIEQPKPKSKLGVLGLGGFEDGDEWRDGVIGDDDGYDEDAEDGFGHDGDWGLDECAIGSDSDSDYNEEIFIQDEDDDDDDGIIEMRSSRKNDSKRSKSKSSDSSSTTTSSADSYSSSSTPSSKRYSSTPRKPLPPSSRRRAARVNLPRRKSSSSHSPSEKETLHVTIAPIAPTILKTGNSSWDGFGVCPPSQRAEPGAWMESFGDDGYSDDGGVGTRVYSVVGGTRDSDNDGINTPVELVYVPPTGKYGGNWINSPTNASPSASASNVETIEDSSAKAEKDVKDDDRGDKKDVVEETVENGDKVYRHQQVYFSMDDVHPEGASSSLPIVVRTPPAVARGGGSDDEAEEDAYDYFGGPDLGGDYASKRTRTSLRRKDKMSNGVYSTSGDLLVRDSSSSSILLDSDANRERRSRYRDDEPVSKRGSRSRSRSRSRTPSPIYVPISSTPAISVPGRNTSPPQPSGSSALLSPPSRGSPQLPQPTSRGRSSTRSSPSSLSDRERSNHGSPLGSLSPEGSAIGIAYGAYANGRGGGDREPQRERGRKDGERGRDRTGRSLSHSLSPDVSGSVPTSPNSCWSNLPSETNTQGSANISSSSSSVVSTVSSSSSSLTAVPPKSDTGVEQQPSSMPSPVIPIPLEIRDEDEIYRSTSTHPTPVNSPVISMSSVAHRIAEMDGKTDKDKDMDSKILPLNRSGPHISSPKISSAQPSTSPPTTVVSRPINGHTRTASGSLQTNQVPGREGDDGIVGKAVGIVSSAGAYLGLWNNGTTV